MYFCCCIIIHKLAITLTVNLTTAYITMQTIKQQQVTNFLNKQAQAHKQAYSTAAQPGFMDAVVTAIEFAIIAVPFAIAIAGFCGAFDALVK